MSQAKEILTYLESGKSLTSLEAISLFGCDRLASRIDELRQAGYNIVTDTIKKGKKTYGSYRLVMVPVGIQPPEQDITSLRSERVSPQSELKGQLNLPL